MGLGGSNKNAIGYGPVSDSNSIEAIQFAFDNGINYYDTAPLYGLGHRKILVKHYQAFDKKL